MMITFFHVLLAICMCSLEKCLFWFVFGVSFIVRGVRSSFSQVKCIYLSLVTTKLKIYYFLIIWGIAIRINFDAFNI